MKAITDGCSFHRLEAATAAASILIAVAGCGSTGPVQAHGALQDRGPQTAVEAYIKAWQAGDANAMCAVVVPEERQECADTYSDGVPQPTVTNLAFHQTVISDDRALVSATGTICAASQCEGNTSPNEGMPSPSLSFDEAWNAATTSTTSITSACQRINGKWYLFVVYS